MLSCEVPCSKWYSPCDDYHASYPADLCKVESSSHAGEIRCSLDSDHKSAEAPRINALTGHENSVSY